MGESVISWGSRKQKTVALSTTKSEFIAACGVAQEIIWTRYLIESLFKNHALQTPILYIDNQSTICIMKDQRFNNKTKHIDIKYKFVREYYKSDFYSVNYMLNRKVSKLIYSQNRNQ